MLSKDGDKKMRMTSALTNLKIEKQDPGLFEIPAGYTKNDMGAMMGMGGMPNMEDMKKNARQRQPAGKQPREGQAGESLGDQMPDMNKMMKGLFGK
jgi:hypothetical protein